MKTLGMILASFCLVGCTTTGAQLYSGYEQAAKKGVEAADDNTIKSLMDGICATPIGAVLRHPEFQSVVKDACMPAGTPAPILPISGAVK
jgi:hypothetical protein